MEEKIVTAIKKPLGYDKLFDDYKKEHAKILRDSIIKRKSELKELGIKLPELFKKTWPLVILESQERAINLANSIRKYNVVGRELWEKLTPKIESEVRLDIPDLKLKGVIDQVAYYPNEAVPSELKTGKATKGKLTKTRKELCFYRHMLSLLGHDEALYFYYLFPECTNTELYLELEGKKDTEVWLGDKQGMAVLEKVSKRSVSAMMKSLDKTIEGINDSLWNMKWNDWFCNEWCDFNMSCEGELIGIDSDPTDSYTEVWE